MPQPPRSHTRQRQDFDDYDDAGDDDFSSEIRQEKTKQLLFDLLGRWHWIALGLILGFLGGLYYLSKAPKTYQAASTLLVKQRTSSVMADRAEQMESASVEGMNTVAQRVTRLELLKKVASRPDIRELPGLVPPPVKWLPAWAETWFADSGAMAAASPDSRQTAPPVETLAGMIGSWTKISIVPKTLLLNVGVTHPTPKVAQAVANAIAIEYIAELTGVRSKGNTSSLEILVKESENARSRLQAAQNALASYQRALTTLKELEARESAVIELARRYLPKHPRLAAATSELKTFQDRFLMEFESARSSPTDKEYWAEHAAEWDKVGLEDTTARLLVARRLLLARGSVLESEIVSQNSVFNSLLTRMQETDINQQAVEAEMEISELAGLPGGPISPKPPQALAAASMGGIALGMLLALISVRLDNKLHTVAQAERETRLPVLAAISDIQPKILAGVTRKHKVDAESIPEARRRWDPHLVFREGTSSSTFAEMFRVLRTSVSLLGDEKKRRITLFSSALPGEGKTLVAANYALAAAQQGKRVLLIDLDLRKPAVHKIFGVKRDAHAFGSTEVLAGLAAFTDALFTETGEPHLHLMLSGKQAPNPGELLNATTLEELLANAAAAYDIVVVDSAPLLAVPDTRIIAPLADNFCLITRAEYVPKGAVRRAISLLESDHNLPSGIVFNGFLEKRRLIGQNYTYGNYQTNRYGKAYRYGYGSYGSYGSDQNDEEDAPPSKNRRRK